MKTYKNPNCKKTRGSHVLEIRCAYCGCFIAHYQKVGETNLVKMYNERILDGSIDFAQYHGALFCPDCGARIATRYTTKIDKKEAYRPPPFTKEKCRQSGCACCVHIYLLAGRVARKPNRPIWVYKKNICRFQQNFLAIGRGKKYNQCLLTKR